MPIEPRLIVDAVRVQIGGWAMKLKRMQLQEKKLVWPIHFPSCIWTLGGGPFFYLTKKNFKVPKRMFSQIACLRNGGKDHIWKMHQLKNVQKEISVGSFERFGHFTDLYIKGQRIRGNDGESDPQQP